LILFDAIIGFFDYHFCMLPSLKQLRYLCAVAEHRHFSKAAEACHVTQSTLSAGVQELESQLGVVLFERNKKQVLITPLGERLISHARNILGDVEDFVRVARSHEEALSGDIRLGVIPTVGPFILPEILKNLRSKYSRLKLYLKEDLTSRLTDKLQQGQLDLVLMAFPYAMPEMETQLLFDDEFQLLLPPEHRLEKLSSIRQKHLQGERLLLLEEGHCLRDHALEACKLDNSQMDLVYEGTSLHTLVQMVANGLGITLLPEIAVQANIIGDTGLQLRRFKDETVRRQIGLAWRKSDPRKADYLLLAEFIKTYLATEQKRKSPQR